MPPPRLTLACELEPARLSALFANPAVIGDLQALGARIALMLSDLSDERARVVQVLNRAGVPVIAVPLLPLGEGYRLRRQRKMAENSRPVVRYSGA